MLDPSLPVQKAVFDTLRAALGDAVGVHDRVPLDAARKVTARFPYVHIGEDHVVSEADQCHDASSIFVTVHVWSRAVGKVEAKTITAQVAAALDAKLAVEGFEIVAHVVHDGPRHMTDADGLTSHSVVTVRYRLGPVS